MTALATPFLENENVDYKTYEQFVEWQLSEGIFGLVPCGTTGESPTVTDDEKLELYKICVDKAKGKRPIVAGTGSNCTRKTIELSQKAQEANVDALLVITPYYNKPTQEGLFQHYKAIDQEVDLPIIVYNVPGRTAVDLLPETQIRLANELKNIAGVKEAASDLSRAYSVARGISKPFAQLSGDDATTLLYMVNGGDGCISVTSNLFPKLCSEMYQAFVRKDLTRCQQINDLLMPVHKILFCESNPAPLKHALVQKGIFKNDQVRLPLWKISEASQQKIDKVIDELEKQCLENTVAV